MGERHGDTNRKTDGKLQNVQIHFHYLLYMCMIHLTHSPSFPYPISFNQKRMLVHTIACISPLLLYKNRSLSQHAITHAMCISSKKKKKEKKRKEKLGHHPARHSHTQKRGLFYPTCFGIAFPFRFGSGFLTYATPLLITLSSLASFVLALAPR